MLILLFSSTTEFAVTLANYKASAAFTTDTLELNVAFHPEELEDDTAAPCPYYMIRKKGSFKFPEVKHCGVDVVSVSKESVKG